MRSSVLVSVDVIAVGPDFPFITSEYFNVPKLGHGHPELIVEDVGLGGECVHNGGGPGVGVKQLIGGEEPHLLLQVLVVGRVKLFRGGGIQVDVLRAPPAFPSQETEVLWVYGRVGLPGSLVVVDPRLHCTACAPSYGMCTCRENFRYLFDIVKYPTVFHHIKHA